ncbi:unnamed protein product [Microthlaspi erraticum]|uniref:Uncharacterized protein n=1 Tax=Microthlaspi erraticum TaxID=1685480 RepID=A0A6D2KNM8_9BRAS|nr:unnamed protein product [Microthlaspi erraticum]
MKTVTVSSRSHPQVLAFFCTSFGPFKRFVSSTMAHGSENVIPTLRDYFNSQKPGEEEEEDEFMFYRKNMPPRPTKPGNKAKERHGFFSSKERSRRRNISDAEKFSVEQYSSGGFFGVRLNTNGKQQQQQQRSAKPLEPRLQKSFSARMQLPFMHSSSKRSNESTSSTNHSSWFSRIKKMSNPFSKPGEIKIDDKFLRKSSSSPVHLHASLSMGYELGMPVFTFSLDRPDDVYMARTWTDDNESCFVYTFHYIGARRSNKNVSSLIGEMRVSSSTTQICLEAEEPFQEEDLVESNLSEFVLFDMARAQRSGQHSRLKTESENRVSDPWPASDLHPGLEIAAIVIRDSESFGYMKNRKHSRREVQVIVPTGNHGLPDAENSCPTPILQRWRSGGGCDCSGWDMGCHLFVLESSERINDHQSLELFIEGEKEEMMMTMALIREGRYEVSFHAKLSALQAFSVCVAELHRRSEVVVSRGGERSNSLSRCSSLRELIDMETPVNRDTREEVLSSFMPNVTFSPISRV